MQCNVGKFDRLLRAVLGVLVIAAGVVFKSWLGIFGVVFLLTAIFRFCPMYVPFKFNSGK